MGEFGVAAPEKYATKAANVEGGLRDVKNAVVCAAPYGVDRR